ncbi:MAG: lipid-binding SYLF domain-containing protein [Pseudomonadota bacterium]
MRTILQAGFILFVSVALAACASQRRTAPFMETAATIEQDAKTALETLIAENEAAAELAEDAVGVLVFPNIVKGGFIFGGQVGDGALFVDDKTVDYYNSTAASYGLQAGVQRYGYVLFFTSEDALNYLDRSEGFEVGVGPSIVIADRGLGRNFTSTTLRADIYAFVFDQQGLMAGGGIQGTKITPIVRPLGQDEGEGEENEAEQGDEDEA